jgi:hypothetical protein
MDSVGKVGFVVSVNGGVVPTHVVRVVDTAPNETDL